MDSIVDEFAELYKVASSYNNLQENIKTEHLLEMSKITSRETGLPVDIWVDEGKTFTKSGHGKRIKFQGDKSNPNTHNWVPLTISKDPQIPDKNIQHNLSAKEINMIKQFIIINFDALEKLGDIDFGIIDFAKIMKKVQ
jgi:hypothetical protein